MHNLNIICFGDSITYGYQLAKGWPDHLKQKLNQSNIDSRVYNLGIPSQTTKDLLKRFQSELEPRLSSKRTNVIIFAFGANDSAIIKYNQSFINPLDNYIKDLTFAVSTTLKSNPNCTILLLGITKVNDQILANNKEDNQIRSNTQVNDYNKALQEISKKFTQVYFVDTSKLREEMIVNDGLHLNFKGQVYLCKQIIKMLKNKKTS
jgi:lysophospholipase L1-like esterase